MLTYSYKCIKYFDKSFIDIKHAVKSPACPKCGSNSTIKIIVKPGIVFVGEGFYSNDNKNN
jgi:predicted nucleic acid-binding Zn ribbon protein